MTQCNIACWAGMGNRFRSRMFLAHGVAIKAGIAGGGARLSRKAGGSANEPLTWAWENTDCCRDRAGLSSRCPTPSRPRLSLC